VTSHAATRFRASTHGWASRTPHARTNNLTVDALGKLFPATICCNVDFDIDDDDDDDDDDDVLHRSVKTS
jgi:hypothetical protein